MDRETWNAVAFATDVLFKATLLIGLAGVVRLLLRRASASLRQAVGVFALGGVILLPAIAPVLPHWKVPVIPAVLKAPEDGAEHAGGRIENAALPIDDAPAALARVDSARAADPVAAPEAAAPRPRASDFGYGVLASPEVEPVGGKRPAFPIPSAGTIALGLLALWAAGASALLLRLGAGIARVGRYTRAAEPGRDEKWTDLLRELTARVGLTRPVRLLFSDRVPVAVTAGFRRPVLLMPESARRWTPELRRVVLLHELAHVQRGDWIALLLAETAAAIYWFHPLAWMAVRQLRRDSEQAADDLVLKSGTKPSVYAGHLLGIIRSLPHPGHPPLPVMGVARPSQFEARLKAILDPSATRREASAGQLRLAAVFATVAVLTLGALEPWKKAEAAADRGPSNWDTAETIAEAESESKDSEDPSKKCDSEKDEDSGAAPAERAEHEEDGEDADYVEASADVESGAADPQPAEDPEPAEDPGVALPAIMSDARETKERGFVQASRKNPRDGGDWYSRGMEHHNNEEYDEAIAAFRKSIELGHREDAASYNIACGYALKGDADRAFEWLDRAIDEGFGVSDYLGKDDDLDSLRSDPRYAQYRQKARDAKGSASRKETERAVAKYDRLAETDPKNGQAWYKAGYQLYQAGEHDRAAKAFQRSAELGHSEGASLYNAACMLSLKGDRRGAIDHLERAILAGFGSASKLREDDDLDAIRSEPRYRELVKLAGDLDLPDLQQWNWVDKWTRNKERLREDWKSAANDIDAFARQHPQIGRAWFNLGFARIQAGQPEEALRAFEKALQLGHRRGTTMYNIACSYALMDRKDQGFEWLFKAIEAGFVGKGQIRQDEDLDNLRGDPRYRQALKLAEARHDDANGDDD